MAIKSIQLVDVILKEKFIEPILEEMRRDFNRTGFGENKRYELPYNTCHERGLEHDWGKHGILRGGICTTCDGEGLAPPGEETHLWQDCWSCGGRGYESTRYYKHCDRCGFGDIRPGYGV